MDKLKYNYSLVLSKINYKSSNKTIDNITKIHTYKFH